MPYLHPYYFNIKGYTLIELLIALSIISILSISVSSFTRSWIHENYQFAQVNRLVAALEYSRMESIRQARPVTFCGSKDLLHCDGNWNNGQIIKTEGKILRVFLSGRPGETLEWKSNFGKNHHLEFTPLGFTKGQQGSFYYSFQTRQKKGYRIIVSHTGTIRVQNYSSGGNYSAP